MLFPLFFSFLEVIMSDYGIQRGFQPDGRSVLREVDENGKIRKIQYNADGTKQT